jgi:hypothetical protein
MGVKRWSCLQVVLAVAAVVTVVSSGPSALANDMDPVLARMWRYDPTTNQIVTRDDLFDALALELAEGFAPNITYPAETLGWSGMFMGLEATLSVIDSEAMQWRCGIEATGQGSNGGGNGVCDSWSDADGVLFIPSVHVRKGLPYSLELGFQIQYMSNSELVGIGGEIRWSPFEGYREGWAGYLPDVSLAFTGNYVMGSSELALGQLGALVSLSYPFTISGQVTLTPYLGYQLMIVGADHEQVFSSLYVDAPGNWNNDQRQPGTLVDFCRNPPDASPGNSIAQESCDPYLEFHNGYSRNFGQDIAALKYHRLFIGARLIWEHLAVTPQFAVTLPWEVGSATGEIERDSAGREYQHASTGTHFQFSVSVGSDF